MEASTDLFISIIRNNAIIYDKSSTDFKNSVKKEEVWKQVAAESKMTVTAAKKRYLSIRQKYTREKKKQEIQRRSKLPSKGRFWVFFDSLTFLDDHIAPRQTHTNDTAFESKEYVHVQQEVLASQQEVLASQQEEMDLNEPLSNILEDFEEDMDFTPQRPTMHALERSDETAIPISRIVGFSQYSGNALEELRFTDASVEHGTLGEDLQSSTGDINDTSDMLNTSIVPVAANTQPTISISAVSNSLKSNTQPVLVRPATQVQASSRSIPNTLENSMSGSAALGCRIVDGKNTNTSSGTPTNINTNSAPTPETLRKKMDSYLSACSKRLDERSQPKRSPHAPFLAYLGSKLENVPKDKVSMLEVKLLDEVLKCIPENENLDLVNSG